MKFLLGLVVVGLLLFGVDSVARNVAEGRAASYVQNEMDLAEEPEVSLGGTPFLPKALGGTIPDVEVKADKIVAKGLEVDDVVITFESIDVSLGSLMSGDAKGVTSSGGEGSATLTADSLTAYLKEKGVDAEIMFVRGALAVTTPELGTQTGELSLKDGRLSIASPGVPRPIRIRLPGITEGLVYEKVAIDRENIVLDVSVPAGPLRAPAA